MFWPELLAIFRELVSTYSLEIPLMIQIIIMIVGRYNPCNQHRSKMQAN
jgi:hypothetical protein